MKRGITSIFAIIMLCRSRVVFFMNSIPRQQPGESADVPAFHHDGKENIYTVTFEMKLPARLTEVYGDIVML